MGKRKRRDPEERERRKARREARSQKRLEDLDVEAAKQFARVNPDAMREFLTEQLGVDPNDIVKLDAYGTASKHAHVTGELHISVTPPDEDGEHATTETTG